MIALVALYFVVTICAAGSPQRTSPSMRLPRPILKVSNKTQPLPIRDDYDDIANLPRQKDMNRNKLIRRLDTEFDPLWMSIDSPGEAPAADAGTNAGTNPVSSDETQSWLMNELHSLNLSHTPNFLATFPETQSALELWLLERASCPVQYEWAYIGRLFWPPWIKRGTCKARQCSWPAGMRCVPGETNTITLLRWHCMSASPEEEDKSSKRRNKCRWLKVPYPVISECVCSCG